MTSPISHPLFTIDTVTVERGPMCLVRGLSLAVHAGDVLVLRGANGAGKTSLLRVLAGISRPQTGALVADGHDSVADPASYASEIAYWGHKDGFKSDFTVAANLRQWCSLSAAQFDPAVLETVGLGEQSGKPVRYLSAGQRRRLGLARLLLQRSKIWLLDEPFTALDGQGRAAVMMQLEAHRKSGGCVILALHEPLEGISHTRLTIGAPQDEAAA